MGQSDQERIAALDALLAEKRKHEGYLEKLEARRGSTPENVFARLRNEYLTKLTDLHVRASSEADLLGETLRADEAAVAEIAVRLEAATEERIEGELRAEVGEYEAGEWAKKLKELTTRIGKIEAERDARTKSFEHLRTLLVEARGSAALRALVEEEMAPIPEPASASVPAAAAALAKVVEAPSAPMPVAPAAAPATAPASAPAPAAAKPAIPELALEAPPAPAPRVSAAVPNPSPMPNLESDIAAVIEAASAPAPRPSGARPAEPAAPPPAPVATTAPIVERASAPAPAKPSAPMTAGPSFDELAFLNSVVGRTSTPVTMDPPPPPRPSRPVEALKDAPSTGPAAPIVPRASTKGAAAGNDPDTGPLGRPTPRTSQAIKTLKCQECGTLNYPTEWYCERCGGELAAL